MIKKPSKQSETKKLSEDDKAISALKLEYASLLNLYTHTENTISGVFNFYLTLLSAITGAMIVLIQINSTSLSMSYPTVAGLLMFAILVGIITQDSIVNKNIDLHNFTLGLNLLKYRLFQDHVAERAYIFYLYNFWADVSPLPLRKADLVTKIHKKFWWFFPLGTHQLFIAVINSFALAASMIVFVQMLSQDVVATDRIITSGIFVFVLSLYVNTSYARIKFKRGVERFNTASNTLLPWSNNAG